MTLKLDRVDRAPHLSTLVASSISREIAEGRLKPGDQLPTEQELAQTFGVSRNVIREAIARLRSERRIWSQQGRGAFVAETSSTTVLTIDHDPGKIGDSFRALFEVRGLLEVEAAALAAERHGDDDLRAIGAELENMTAALYGSVRWLKADVGFHRAIATATSNPYMTQFLAFVAERVRESILSTGQRQRTDDMAAATLHEHRRILAAIAVRDVSEARTAMHDHLKGAETRIGLARDNGCA